MSIDLSNKKIPKEAIQALKTIAELLDNMLIGVYLYGSAVMGGLRMNSDVDILVITNQSLSEKTRRNLTNRLMLISGKIGNIKENTIKELFNHPKYCCFRKKSIYIVFFMYSFK